VDLDGRACRRWERKAGRMYARRRKERIVTKERAERRRTRIELRDMLHRHECRCPMVVVDIVDNECQTRITGRRSFRNSQKDM